MLVGYFYISAFFPIGLGAPTWETFFFKGGSLFYKDGFFYWDDALDIESGLDVDDIG